MSVIISISPDTYRRLKRRAGETNSTLEQLAETAIRLQFGNTPHIEYRDTPDRPRAMIRGTRVAVWHIATLLNAGLTVEEIVSEALPDLPPAAIDEALAYYHEHEAEIEAEWVANEREAVIEDLRSRLKAEQLTQLMGQQMYSDATHPAG